MSEQSVAKVEETEVVEHEAPVSETATILQVIERAAQNPNVDIDKMERLFAMHQAMLDRTAKQEFADAMKNAQAEIRPVVRDAVNTHTKSRYATLETISDAIAPIYTKHGFWLSFGSDDSPHPNHYRVTATLGHSSGHEKQYHADLPADLAGAKGNVNKPAIQGFGSTMSYGRRYLTLLIFNVALKNEDDDGNAAGIETITEDQAIDIRGQLEEIAANEDTKVEPTIRNFCKFLGVEKITDIPKERYEDAMAALKQKKGPAK